MNEWQNILTALGVLLGAASTFSIGVLVQRRLNRKQNNIAMQDNFQALYEELRKDIARVRTEQADERKQWAEERIHFNKTIVELQKQLRDQDQTMHSKDIEVVKLRGEVKWLTTQLETYKNTHTVKETSTTVKEII
jgi:hypothetical protein